MSARRAGECGIIELRRYANHPGRRDELIELFEREFIAAQEAAGMSVIGQFRDPNDADRFVWLRGFPDMPSRAEALRAFYTGPLWRAHREAANATLIDTDNVLLLRPARPGSGFGAARGVDGGSGGLLAALIWPVAPTGVRAFVTLFARTLEPQLIDAGSSVLATFVSERSENTYPLLPVRENESVFACFVRFVDREAFGRFFTSLSAAALEAPSETYLLTPTEHSRIR